jgi:hypothetical protein
MTGSVVLYLPFSSAPPSQESLTALLEIFIIFQIAEIIKVQSLWTSETSDETQRVKTELSNLGPLMYTLPAAELAKIDPTHVDMKLLTSLESSKLSFPQVRDYLNDNLPS